MFNYSLKFKSIFDAEIKKIKYVAKSDKDAINKGKGMYLKRNLIHIEKNINDKDLIIKKFN